MEYQKYIRLWLDGLYDEISFWRTYISSSGVIGGRRDAWFDYINPDSRFVLDELLPKGRENVKFIDIGSGPFSRCGSKSDKCTLDITCVDPLGNIYEYLKNMHDVHNGNFIKRGFVELLSYQFAPNSFDMVHMSNSLDHCFDPVFGIYHLLNICKIGGKVVLRHHESEAERSKYEGLHQWNLSLHNKENSFVIWNMTTRIDICRIFGKYADFELLPDITEAGGTWVYNQVVITKKNDVVMPPNDYLPEFLMAVYDELVDYNMELVEAGQGKIIRIRRQRIKRQIEEGDYDETIAKWATNGRVVIYGLGVIGKALVDRRYVGYNVIALDKRDFEYKGMRTVSPSDYQLENGDKIIVTVKPDDEIKNFLEKYGIDDAIFLMR